MNSSNIGLAGLGFLGRGIATCLLARGFHVVAFDRAPGAEQTLKTYIEAAKEEIASFTGSSESLVDWPERFTPAQTPADFRNCELIIESITEDLAAKRSLFELLEEHVSSETPIASNTSSLPITLLQAGRKYPGRFAGMHWASPAYATRFLEIIQGAQTNLATIDSIVRIAIELGKDPAVVKKDVPGFIANRIAYAMYREALHLLETGVADAETIDRVCCNSLGLWTALCGPFRWMDITGGPALYGKAMEAIIPSLSNESQVPAAIQRLRDDDARGTMNGRGFYTYAPGSAAQWQAALYEHAWKIERLRDEDSSKR
ncbi:MAG TPA: 3-hydroxyacyl-CoA dehydrogenase family protein [Bryobacteraceae bacterium]